MDSLLVFQGMIAGVVTFRSRRVCRFGGNLDGSLLVHLATDGGQLDTASVLDDVVGRPIADGVFGVFPVDTTAHAVDIHVLRVSGDGGEVVVGLPTLAARELVVAAVVAGFGFDDQVAASQRVQKHIDQTGTGNHSTCHTEVGNARVVALGCCHTPSGQWKRKDNVGNRVNNHVSDDTTQTLETLGVAASQDGGLCNTTTKLEPHNSVQSDRTEFGQENPNIVSPQTHGFILFTNPALESFVSHNRMGAVVRRALLTQAPDGIKIYRP